MVWKNFVGPRAITSRRRVLASAVMYGLSLTVRFTSTAGDETEISAQAAQRTNPMLSIMMNGGQISHSDWPLNPAQSIVFQRGWPASLRGCRSACERPMPKPSIADCLPP